MLHVSRATLYNRPPTVSASDELGPNDTTRLTGAVKRRGMLYDFIGSLRSTVLIDDDVILLYRRACESAIRRQNGDRGTTTAVIFTLAISSICHMCMLASKILR